MLSAATKKALGKLLGMCGLMVDVTAESQEELAAKRRLLNFLPEAVEVRGRVCFPSWQLYRRLMWKWRWGQGTETLSISYFMYLFVPPTHSPAASPASEGTPVRIWGRGLGSEGGKHARRHALGQAGGCSSEFHSIYQQLRA